MLFVGPRDLSLALGVPGDLTAPVYVEALERVLAAAKQHGKAAGVLVPNGAAAARMTADGWQFLAIGSDTTILANAVVSELRPRGATRMTTLSRTDVVVALGEVEPDAGPRAPAGRARRSWPNPTVDDLQRATGAIARADALVDADLLDRTPLLKVVARTGVGVDRVDVAEATRRGIAVVVTPGAGTNAVAEGTLAMTLHLVKRLRVATACVAEGRWAERGASRMGDLEGATIGIVGYGRIGRRVAHLARAFGMTVLAHDPYVEDDPDAGQPGGAYATRGRDHPAPAADVRDAPPRRRRVPCRAADRAPSWSTAVAAACSTWMPRTRPSMTGSWPGSASTSSRPNRRSTIRSSTATTSCSHPT